MLKNNKELRERQPTPELLLRNVSLYFLLCGYTRLPTNQTRRTVGSIRFLTSFWRFVAMDNPDTIALRFLRARKWNITAAVAMLASCIKWRMGECEI